MTVNLTPELEHEMESRVAIGEFASTDELVRAALEQFFADDFAPGELAELVAEGQRDADAGRFVDGEAFFAELRTRVLTKPVEQ